MRRLKKSTPARLRPLWLPEQVAPTFAGISVFKWNINIRESTVLGLVGAGGMGLKLNAALNPLAWPKVTMILIVIFATVVISEWITIKVRQKLL